jgi:hypothetical protein
MGAFEKPSGEDSHRYDVSPAAVPLEAGKLIGEQRGSCSNWFSDIVDHNT